MNARIRNIIAKLGGSALGSSFGFAVGGLFGALGGPIVGTAAEESLRWIGEEINNKALSRNESRRCGKLFELVNEEINKKIEKGKTLRSDDFLRSEDGRSGAEETIEEIFLIAQRESEERKLPYLAKLYANICFDASINRHMAMQIIKSFEQLSFRQLSLIATIGEMQVNYYSKKSINKSFDSINGIMNVSLFTDLKELGNRLIIDGDSLFMNKFNPSTIKLIGVGANIFKLCELCGMEKYELTDPILNFILIGDCGQ